MNLTFVHHYASNTLAKCMTCNTLITPAYTAELHAKTHQHFTYGQH
jgi:hypothetical protein